MRPTRRTQPYRKKGAARAPSGALRSMRTGRSLYGQNPMDARRKLVKRANRRRRRGGLAAQLRSS